MRLSGYFLSLVGTTGFEPAAFSSQNWRDTKLRYVPKYGAPHKNRTRNLQIRSLTLYPVELEAHLMLTVISSSMT